jgi:pimeloyl-ACP methyl ester carboxylesterase
VDKSTATLSNGTRIAYLERTGGDVPLVLLHGITDNARTYEPVLARISPRCHVFALDLRGHGESAKPDALYDADAYADDVRHFIQEITGGSALLQGHSLGGVVAVQVASTAPALVSGLFLEDPPLYFANDLNEIFRTLFNGMVTMAKTLQNGSRSPDDWFEVMANAPDPYSGKPGIETMGAEQIRLRLDSIAMMKPKALEDALAKSLEWDTDQILERLQCPLMMITGNPDLGAVISTEESARVTDLVSDSRVLQFDDVGHLIHDERLDAWLSALNDWIERVGRAFAPTNSFTTR